MKIKDSTDEIKLLHSQVKELLKKNYTHEEIVDVLKQKGLEPYYIETIIENIEQEKEDKVSFRNSTITGIFFIISGFAINIFSYRLAESANNSFFYVFWGIIVVGIVTVIRGFILYRR